MIDLFVHEEINKKSNGGQQEVLLQFSMSMEGKMFCYTDAKSIQLCLINGIEIKIRTRPPCSACVYADASTRAREIQMHQEQESEEFHNPKKFLRTRGSGSSELDTRKTRGSTVSPAIGT